MTLRLTERDERVLAARADAVGQHAYSSLELKAAALMDALVNNHALHDGNKRLGWLATLVGAPCFCPH